MTRQLVEAAHDGWLALSGGIWTRAIDGWHALTPLGRIAGTGAAALLALAGVGTFAEESEQVEPPPEQHAAAPVTSGARPGPSQARRVDREPKRAAATSRARPRPKATRRPPRQATAGGGGAEPFDGSGAVQPHPTTRRRSRRSEYSAPAPSRAVSDEALARSEFEPGPP